MLLTRLLTLLRRLLRPQQPAPAPAYARSTAVSMDDILRAYGADL